jgi:HD-GYP domain-containing protein (c-di-GMP phosphodiesterase class II)
VRAQLERSPALGPHASDVGELAAGVAEHLGLAGPRVELVRQAAELHDVGKIAIPDAVLDKPGPLSADEWQLIREHTLIGERILSAAPALQGVSRIVRASHERFDGSGYPDGAAGEEISLEARIVCAADAYSAMVSDRPYHRAMSTAEAAVELRRCAGRQFDPSVVEALVAVLGEPFLRAAA